MPLSVLFFKEGRVGIFNFCQKAQILSYLFKIYY